MDSRADGDAAPRATRFALAARTALYLCLVVGLSNLLLVDAIDRGPLQYVRNGVAHLAALVLSPFVKEVSADGGRVFVGPAAVEIVNGCTGLDVGVFLASAILVFPAPWRARLRGMAVGFAVVMATNFARVLTLCVLNATSPRAFELVHVYVWPAVISLVCLATLLVWIKSTQPADV